MFQLIYFILFSFFLCGNFPQSPNNSVHQEKILFVVSNADYYGNSKISASNHFAEIVYPYHALREYGFHIDFISPGGGSVPLGYFNTSDSLIRQYIYDCDFMQQLAHTNTPSQIDALEYDAIFFSGGGASMFGIADNPEIMDIARVIYEQNKGIVSAVCHGSISLSNIKLSNGNYLVDGKNINGFPDIFENKEAEYFKEFEYSVEALLKKRGAKFQYSENGWDGFYQIDQRVITGQDPSSAKKVADLIAKNLK